MTSKNEPGSPNEKLYTIGTVSELTGVSAITLRAWERRYELIHPVRKESGHRLYTRKHIDQINRINILTGQGMRMSQIKLEMLETASAGDDPDNATETAWGAYLDSMTSAIITFDEEQLEEIYNEVLSLYPIELATRMLLKPLLIELGLRWEAAAGSIAEEHFFAFYLRNKLGARFHHRSRSETGSRLLLAGLPGEYHEIAMLLFALSANNQGFRLLSLGTNMPLYELAHVSKQARCDAIVLSGSNEPSAGTLTKDLPCLVSALGIPVFVGGPASVFACDAINKAGAEALGQDMEHGLRRLKERLDV